MRKTLLAAAALFFAVDVHAAPKCQVIKVGETTSSTSRGRLDQYPMFLAATIQLDDDASPNAYMRHVRPVVDTDVLYHEGHPAHVIFSPGHALACEIVHTHLFGAHTALRVQYTDEKGKVKDELHNISQMETQDNK